MKKANLNIPVTLVHEMDGVKYNISGTLTAIDESSETCRVRFDNGRVENRMPLKYVYVNEGLVDTIKKYGKALTTWVVRKVKGLVAFLNADGKIDENSYHNYPTLVALQADGKMPVGLRYYPSDNAVSQAKSVGVNSKALSIDQIFDEPDPDIAGIERFWLKIMRHYSTHDTTANESFRYVCEHDYGINPDGVRPVNEGAVISLEGVPDAVGRFDTYGEIVSMTQLRRLIKNNIESQVHFKAYARNEKIMNDPKRSEQARKDAKAANHAYDVGISKRGKPLLIWGAPGVGKTQSIKSALKEIKAGGLNGAEMNIMTISVANMDKDSFFLPVETSGGGDLSVKGGEKKITSALLSYLPAYEYHDGDDAYNAKQEAYYASSAHLTHSGFKPTENFQGGVLFLDELFRINDNAIQTIMRLAEGQIQDSKLANSWAVIFASNRQEDDPDNEYVEMAIKNYTGSVPIENRFVSVTLVPTKKEFLDWATKENPERHAQNVSPLITNFLKTAPDKMWYRTVDNGGYDEEVGEYVGEKFKGQGLTPELWKAMQGLDDEKNFMRTTTQTWNSRTWEDVTVLFRQRLDDLIDRADPPTSWTELTEASKEENGDDYIGISEKVMKRDVLDAVTPDDFADWAADQSVDENLVFDKNGEPRKLNDTQKMNVIYEVLYRVIHEVTGGQKHRLKQAPKDNMVVAGMKDYYDWQNVFIDKRVVKSIYTTGLMPKGYKDYDMKDDAGYAKNGGFAWKTDTEHIAEVEEFIMRQYPGGVEQAKVDFQEYLDFFENVGEIDKYVKNKAWQGRNVSDLMKFLSDKFGKLGPINAAGFQEMLTVHTATQKYGDIVLTKKPINKYVATVLWNAYTKCQFLSRMVNLVKYFVKVDFSVNNFQTIGMYAETKEADSKGYKRFVLKDEIIKTYGLNDASDRTRYGDMHSYVTDIVDTVVRNKGAISAQFETLADFAYFDVFTLLNIMLRTAIDVQNGVTFSKKAFG